MTEPHGHWEHLEFVKADIFGLSAEALVNPVNCVGTSGAGLAKAFKTRFPENQTVYEQVCKIDGLTPGGLLAVDLESGSRPRWILNVPTKRHWKEKSDYDTVCNGMLAIVDWLVDNPVETIAVPALGCGYGGLSWRKVKRIAEQSLGAGMVKRSQGDVKTRIIVCEPQ